MSSSTTQDLSALIPEIWANEGLMLLEEGMVMAPLVHRDFDDKVAKFGDTVNVDQIADFTAKRKRDIDEVSPQDAVATNVPVLLNQHVYTSFFIRDGEMSKSMQQLVTKYLAPALTSQARFLDQCLLGVAPAFLTNTVGSLKGMVGGLIGTQTAQPYLTAARQKMNENKVPAEGRNMIWAPNSETAALNTDLFVSAEKVGDGGFALRTAELGTKFGFRNFMSLNGPADDPVTPVLTTTTDTAEAIGDTVIGLTSTTGAVAGDFITLVDDDYPRRIASVNAGVSVTLSAGIRAAVASGKVAKVYGDLYIVDLTGHTSDDATVTAYGIGHGLEIYIDTGGGASSAVSPVPGSIVAFGTHATHPEIYTVVKAEIITTVGVDYKLTLDRPLEVAITDALTVHFGPPGDYNFGFHRNAIALVNRPLALPMAGTGVRAAVATYNNMSMRVVITYDGYKQGHLVTCDALFGVKALNTDLGVVMLG